MRLEVRQQFDGLSSEQIRDAYLNANLYERFTGLKSVTDPSVLLVDDGRVEVRYTYGGDLPPGASVFVDASRLTWVERSVYDPATGDATFELAPDHYPKLLRCRGTIRIERDSRVVSAELNVDLGWKGRLVEGRVEKVIADGVRDAIFEQTPIVAAFIAN